MQEGRKKGSQMADCSCKKKGSQMAGLDHIVDIGSHGSLGFMVNNHPAPRAEPEDKDGYCKP